MAPIEKLARIAEIEFSDIVDTTELIGTKLRIMLTKEGFIDVWLSRKLANRFGYHWEDKSTGLSYRYDNFPIPSGNMFPPIRITFMTVLRTT